ncbi:polysaccharide biosynthesis protein GumE [Rhodoplanes elegans]|uniref:polysaccharide biosynthesis protein GumE n=1 Tax=Rhodoplanes elegans TaxID=29408 RepID=UPI0011B93838|nr:polysaccharide biosynthesis protein GumE [Rhodoplanes elegans]
MTSHAVPLRESLATHRPLRVVPGLLVIAAVCFNAGLAVVNGNITSLGPALVIAAEMALVLAAHAVALANYRPQMLPWYLLGAALLVVACWRSMALQQFDPKYFRDVLIIPTFVVLGMTFDRRSLNRVVVIVHAVVMITLVFEILATDAYSAVFKVKEYYINTRGYDVQSFWNKNSDLFVNAVRPDSRLFSFLDLHRVSSVFLEPVSLGSYCIVIIAFICARYEELSRTQVLFLVGGTLIAMLGSDSRLAAMSSVLIVAITVMGRRLLPRSVALVYLPVVLAVAFLYVTIGGIPAGSDDFPGRIAHTVHLLSRFSVDEFLGISSDPILLSESVDSGIGYLVLTQSIFGVALIWGAIVLASANRSSDQVRYVHAVCVYLSLTMIVSFAFLSIKTASLLWFVYGVLQLPQRPQAKPDLRSVTRSAAAHPLRRRAALVS